MKCAIIAALFVALAATPAMGQSDLVSLDSSASLAAFDKKVTIQMTQAPVEAILTQIATQAGLRLTYDPALPGLAKRTTIWMESVAARTALQRVLRAGALTARVSASGQVVIAAAPMKEEDRSRVVLRGTVRTPAGEPLESARIELTGTRYATYSGADGRFVLGEVPADTYTVRAMRIGSRPDIRSSVVVDRDHDSIDLVLEPMPVPLAEVVVTPSQYGLIETSLASSRRLDRVQLQTTPQFGEDIYRVVAHLPGVAGDDFSAKFAVRGATADELFVTLDGLPLIEPFHLRDMANALSIIDIQTLHGAELIAGGAPVRYGEHTGGVMTMETIDPRRDRKRGSTGLSLMNARVMAQGGSDSGRVSWLVSARRGYLDIALKMAGITDSFIPRYYDVFGKVGFDAGHFGRLSVHALAAQDRFQYLSGTEPELRSRYSSDYVWGRWEGQLGDAVTGQTVLSFGRLEWDRDANQVKDGAPAILIRDRRWLDRMQLRQEWTATLSDRFLLDGGGEVSRENADYDYFNWIRRWTVSSTGVVSSHYDTTMATVAPTSDAAGGFLSLRTRVLPSLTLETGGRVDRASPSNEAELSPRLNAVWEATRATTLRAAWGRHNKAQPLNSLQVQNGERELAPPDLAEQREVSVQQRMPLSLDLRVQAYQRRTTRQRPLWVNVTPNIDAAPELAYDRVLIRPGLGLARGVEFSVGRERSTHADWNLAYTLAKVTDDIGGVTVPRSYDQRHAINVDWAVHPVSNKWRLTVSGMWHSGWPYTPDVVRVDTITNTPQTFSVFTERELGMLNSQRTPAYSRVDARWTRYFDTRRGRVMFFADVFNLLDRHNVRGNYTNVAVSGRAVYVSGGERVSIGRLPTVGFSWEF